MQKNPTFQSQISFQPYESVPHLSRSSNTFSSNLFNPGQQPYLKTSQTRVHPSNQSHNIFGEKQSKKTQVKENGKQPRVRENPNTSGKQIFEQQKPVKVRERINDNIQDNNLFESRYRNSKTVKPDKKKEQKLNYSQKQKIASNMSQDVIIGDKSDDYYYNGYKFKAKKQIEPEFKEVDPKKMKQQFVYGDKVHIIQKNKEKEMEHYHQDPKVMRVRNTQCKDILFTGKYNEQNIDDNKLERKQKGKHKLSHSCSAFQLHHYNLYQSSIHQPIEYSIPENSAGISFQNEIKYDPKDKQRQSNHTYSNLFEKESVSIEVNNKEKKNTSNSTNTDWKQTPEQFMTQPQKMQRQQELQGLDCKQMKRRDLGDHFDSRNGQWLDSNVVGAENGKGFDKVKKREFKVEGEGRKGSETMRLQEQQHCQVFGDHTISKDDKDHRTALVKEYQLNSIPEQFDENGFRQDCHSNGVQIVELDRKFDYLGQKYQGDGKVTIRCKEEGQADEVVSKLKENGLDVQEFQEPDKQKNQYFKQTAQQNSSNKQLQKHRTMGAIVNRYKQSRISKK